MVSISCLFCILNKCNAAKGVLGSTKLFAKTPEKLKQNILFHRGNKIVVKAWLQVQIEL